MRQAHLYADDGFGNMIPLHPVTLVDGTVVSSYSEAWRHECECATVLAWPRLQDRRDYLYGAPGADGKPSGGILGKRGEAAVKQMEATMLALWKARKG